MNQVSRVYPGAVNGLINWMEQNFHDIDQFAATFTMKDGTTMTVYDAYSYLEAVGIAGITLETIHTLSREDEFVPKER